MKVYVANFGVRNHFWNLCKGESVIVTFEMEEMRPFWEAGDREGYIAHALATQKTAAGFTPTRSVASRWFNIATTVSNTGGDLWIHREKEELWWTISEGGDATVNLEDATYPGAKDGERIYLIRKRAQPWRNENRRGTRLAWNALHPKACDFLFTEGTLQSLREENAAYAAALVNGDDLTPWHNQPTWKEKESSARRSPAAIANAKQNAAARMAFTALQTTRFSNGQVTQRTVKNKEFGFASQIELEQYILDLIDAQSGLCALSGIELQYDSTQNDNELLCSLDRIDSNRHYERGNLQVVCRFLNRWKSSDDDVEFRRLIRLLRDSVDV